MLLSHFLMGSPSVTVRTDSFYIFKSCKAPCQAADMCHIYLSYLDTFFLLFPFSRFSFHISFIGMSYPFHISFIGMSYPFHISFIGMSYPV